MLWQLPDERRLRVVRGGLRRDWRAGAQVMGGLSLIGLLTLTLALWPVHARHNALPNISAASAAVSAVTPLPPPHAAADERFWTPSTYQRNYQNSNYRSASVYRHLALPVPGLPDAYASTSPSSRPLSAFQNGYYSVPPAAPTALGPSVSHYSY